MDAVHTNVIKRNGEEVNFDLDKIVNAINAANKEVDRLHQLNDYQVQAIADNIAKQIEIMTHAIHVEDIQDMVETGIMEMRGYEVAQKYVRYRYKRELARKSNTTDNGILALIDHMNEEVNQENSNKNPVINSTQRDYMAGEVSKDLTKRMLLPKEIVEAHEQGIIHFHDSDYFAQREHNCDLVNLEDMLQNGTVISETMIEKPHSFFTACNVTTQIVAQVASNQYGGQSFTLSHIAPFVDVSRKKIREQVIEERKMCGEALDEKVISKITESRLRAEVKSGIQTIQYQLSDCLYGRIIKKPYCLVTVWSTQGVIKIHDIIKCNGSIIGSNPCLCTACGIEDSGRFSLAVTDKECLLFLCTDSSSKLP